MRYAHYHYVVVRSPNKGTHYLISVTTKNYGLSLAKH